MEMTPDNSTERSISYQIGLSNDAKT
ncbi:hypothetical protein MESS4_30023 [Mesorhizobium sp. STM 4661]|nr:hypothetical protein MESS4_30023 [Mesorhizobium sp. STM 4661]